jgi:CheY-like chemotaxis protein
LIVEDDPPSRQVLEELLEDDGYDVMIAKDGLEALRVVEGRVPDVVVSDVQMPMMDGPTLLEHLAKRIPGVPVVLMSANADARERAARACAFVLKPIDFGVLEHILESACATKVRREWRSVHRHEMCHRRDHR